MRKRTEKEKEAMGRIVPVLESLKIKKSTRGYVPLLDIMSYAAAYPEVKFKDIVNILLDGYTYIGITDAKNKPLNHLFPAMVRTIETALEKSNDAALVQLGMSEEIITKILDSDNYNEDDLLAVLGEQYKDYSHEERIVFYFIKKVLNYLHY